MHPMSGRHRWRVVHTVAAPCASGAPSDVAIYRASSGAGTLRDGISLATSTCLAAGPERNERVDGGDPARRPRRIRRPPGPPARPRRPRRSAGSRRRPAPGRSPRPPGRGRPPAAAPASAGPPPGTPTPSAASRAATRSDIRTPLPNVTIVRSSPVRRRRLGPGRSARGRRPSRPAAAYGASHSLSPSACRSRVW